MNAKKFIVTLIFFVAFSAAAKQPHTFPPDAREKLPNIFNQTYLGGNIGHTNIPFSNANLINGFRAENFTNPDIGLSLFIGHFFNRYLAGQINLMRPIKWVYANNVTPKKRHSIWISLFGITLRPTLPITPRWSLYGLEGVGIVSRHGFSVNYVTAIPSVDLMTGLFGGGVTYAINSHWHWDTGVQVALARPAKQQPAILYAFSGFYYLFEPLHLPRYYTTHYIFHKNTLKMGAFSTSIFDPGINKYFTVHYLPIFWSGDIHARQGVWLIYERNIFHTHKRFSFNIGTSSAFYCSAIQRTTFQTISVFPDLRFWFYRSNKIDGYFDYSIAGPTYITHRVIDHFDSGGHFTFQDLMGVGFFCGKRKNMNVDFKIGHYSNGNLFPNNPGIQVPLVISAGYAF